MFFVIRAILILNLFCGRLNVELFQIENYLQINVIIFEGIKTVAD